MLPKKTLTIQFTFDEVPDEYDPDYSPLELVSIKRTKCDLDESQVQILGEDMAQSDTWQVDHWIDIQNVMAAPLSNGRAEIVLYP